MVSEGHRSCLLRWFVLMFVMATNVFVRDNNRSLMNPFQKAQFVLLYAGWKHSIGWLAAKPLALSFSWSSAQPNWVLQAIFRPLILATSIQRARKLQVCGQLRPYMVHTDWLVLKKSDSLNKCSLKNKKREQQEGCFEPEGWIQSCYIVVECLQNFLYWA